MPDKDILHRLHSPVSMTPNEPDLIREAMDKLGLEPSGGLDEYTLTCKAILMELCEKFVEASVPEELKTIELDASIPVDKLEDCWKDANGYKAGANECRSQTLSNARRLLDIKDV